MGDVQVDIWGRRVGGAGERAGSATCACARAVAAGGDGWEGRRRLTGRGGTCGCCGGGSGGLRGDEREGEEEESWEDRREHGG